VIEFERADIRNYEAIAPLIRGRPWCSTKRLFLRCALHRRPGASHEVNIDGTFNVLRAAKEGQADAWCTRVQFGYGDTDVLPKVESMMPGPNRPTRYRSSWRILQQHLLRGYGWRRVAALLQRVRAAAGPSSAYSGVLSLFMKAVLERQAPPFSATASTRATSRSWMTWRSSI